MMFILILIFSRKFVYNSSNIVAYFSWMKVANWMKFKQKIFLSDVNMKRLLRFLRSVGKKFSKLKTVC